MTIEVDFVPHRILRGGHLQTLAGLYLPNRVATSTAEVILVDVPSPTTGSECGAGAKPDRIALHDDYPADWDSNGQVVLLIHGLAGCYTSGYMARIANRLNENGVRTFRMDMRGTGAATGLSKLPGHAGRTEDAAAAIHEITKRCPDAWLTLVGFSMGGNIALGTLANAAAESIGILRRGIAVGPPVDLSKCCRELGKGFRKAYDKYLIHHLVQRWQATGGELMGPKPTSIYQFDDQITAPLSGFRDAKDYYAHASSGPRLKEIALPTRILAAKDDPVVAYSAIECAERSEAVTLYVSKSGGHLGFVTNRSTLPDRRWMDWQVVDWVLSDW